MSTQLNIKIIIADDHDIYREGLRAFLSSCKGMEVIAEVSNGRLLANAVKHLQPDVILTDLKMPVMSGIQAIKEICTHPTKVGIIVISTFESDNLIIQALAAGAKGYIMKNADKEEIINAIESVHNQKDYYCRSTSPRLIRLISKNLPLPGKPGIAELFNDLEKKIIYQLCLEKQSDEIGGILCMGKRTVDMYRARIIKKMDVNNLAGLVIYAIRNGLFSLDDLED